MDEQEVRSRAQLWLTDHFDEHTRNEVQRMLDHDANELKESFYTDLEFGTGGLRGIMGVGTNRVNVYTIGLASLGLAKYVRKNGNQTSPSLAIAHDSRNNSPLFARKAAEIFASQGIKVYLFSALRPTPELSFAVRHLKCDGGVVITASHNPKEYNGYKVYWNDGAQVIPPHDKGIIEEVRQARIEDLDFNSNHELIQLIDKEVDEPYLHAVMNQQLAPEVVKEQHDLKIVYTALHGTGITLIPEVLSRMGFT